MSEKVPSSLLKQDSALGNYLDDMLQRATQVVQVQEVDLDAGIDRVLLPEELLLDTEVASKVTLVEAPPADGKTESICQATELISEMFPLQCLMFKVAENLLSIPLCEMHSIVEWPDNWTHLPHEPDWILGILNHRGNHVRIVDSAEILQIKRNGDQRPAHILALAGEKWGITCDEVGKVVTVEYDDIKWNQNKTRPMTFGTIRSSLSSLLNPQGIIECLQSGLADD